MFCGILDRVLPLRWLRCLSSAETLPPMCRCKRRASSYTRPRTTGSRPSAHRCNRTVPWNITKRRKRLTEKAASRSQGWGTLTHTSGEHALGVVGCGGADFEVFPMCLLPFHCQKSAIGCLSHVVRAAQGRERAVRGAATSRTYQVSMPRG